MSKYCLDMDKPVLWRGIDKETGEVKYEWKTNPVLDGFEELIEEAGDKMSSNYYFNEDGEMK